MSDQRPDCYGCIQLISQVDGAGGEKYFCGRLTSWPNPSGLILGENALWSDPEIDTPRPLKPNCKELRP